MQRIKWMWNAFKNVAILFSFVVNLILVITLLLVVGLLYPIKNGIAEPLIDGLHASFVGLDRAVIDRIIPVREEIPVQFTLPLEQNTTVVLTSPVPLQASAQFVLPGGGGTINGNVSIVLPSGLQLPVALDLDVPVDTMLPVSLDVRAVIPLSETQLHDPFVRLRDLLEPFVRALDNLPGNPEEGQAFLNRILAGDWPYLLTPTEDSMNPWTEADYSMPAGQGYTWPADMPPQPGEAGQMITDGPSRSEQPAVTATPASEEAQPTPIETGPPPEGDLGILPTPGS